MIRRGFTLIELLVVMAIMAILVGMVLTAMSSKGNATAVELAAEEVCAVLNRARNTALATRSSTSVVFNIQNAPGSSGRVINNRSGGHWCRILSAARRPITVNPAEGKNFFSPPFLTTGRACSSAATTTAFYFTTRTTYRLSEGTLDWPTFPKLVEEIRACWASEPYALPRGKVRFLALGDSDEGPRLYGQRGGVTRCSRSGVNFGYGTTYPRPYFGWFDATATPKRLYPWGGYDPTLPSVTSFNYGTPTVFNGTETVSTYSGLCYQAPIETPIPDSRNPVDLKFPAAAFSAANLSSLTQDTGPLPADGYVLRRAGEPRALVDGNWGDFAIVFEADGTAWFPAMKCNRKWYDASVCGPGDSKAWSLTSAISPGQANTDAMITHNLVAPNGESIHYQRHTGRAFITLAPDSPDDADTFDSAQQALRSLMPMYRVFVSASGMIGSFPVRHDEDALDRYEAEGWTPWPSDPAIFAMSTAADQDSIDMNYRFGWLHRNPGGIPPSSPSFYTNGNAASLNYWWLEPRGMPITDRVSTGMMTRRIWWLDR